MYFARNHTVLQWPVNVFNWNPYCGGRFDLFLDGYRCCVICIHMCDNFYVSNRARRFSCFFTYVCIKIAKGQYFIHLSLLNTFCKLKSSYITTPTIKSPWRESIWTMADQMESTNCWAGGLLVLRLKCTNSVCRMGFGTIDYKI